MKCSNEEIVELIPNDPRLVHLRGTENEPASVPVLADEFRNDE
jgi:hypothetical protein